MLIHLTEVDDKGKPIGVTDINTSFTEQELDEYKELFCKCDYLEKHPKLNPEYVENYNGISHGWICPKCKKFIQIG